MSTILRYVLVDRDDREADGEYHILSEAIAAASDGDHAIIEREYEYSDSSLVWTPNGADTWPPANPTRENLR